MNYKLKDNREDFLKFKEDVIKKLDEFLDQLLDESSPSYESNYKRCVNLTYWLKDYRNMLNREKGFSPRYLPVYNYGTIVYVSLGFNVGSEHGGAHYCVVLNKDDDKSSPVLTVMPLSSVKDGVDPLDLHKYELYLGNEMYNALNLKIKTMMASITDRVKELQERFISAEDTEKENIRKEARELNAELQYCKDCIDKSESLKPGSCALLNQITTISKMRILEPTKTKSPLYGVSLSTSTMDTISAQARKYFL